MQLIPRYILNDRIDVISDNTGFVVEYRPVYSRQIKVYRGIDNKIQFRLLNADQKPIRVTETPVLVAFGEDDTKLLDIRCTVQDDLSSTSTKGLFEVTITENHLLNVKEQYLHYNIYLEGEESNSLTYSNRDFKMSGVINVDSDAYPGPKSSVSIVNFKEENNVWIAGNDDVDKITAYPGLNGNNALHTIAVYSTGYAGDIKVQGTLDNQITGQNTWTTIDTLTLSGTETSPVPLNFNGVFTYIRFELDEDPNNKIEKILMRN